MAGNRWLRGSAAAVAMLGIAMGSSGAAAASAGLPDNRAYELVSPVDKNGQDIVINDEAHTGPWGGFAAEDGGAAIYKSWGPLPGSTSAGLNIYRALRGDGGWISEAIQPPHAPKSTLDLDMYQWFSNDLTVGAFVDADPPLVSGAPTGVNNLYVKTFGGATELVTPVPPLHAPQSTYYFFNGYDMVGRSRDGTHVVFESTDALTPDAPAFAKSLYDFSGGQLHLLGVLPDGTPDPAGSVGGAGSGTWSFFEISAGSLAHAVSDNGTSVFWTSSSDGQVYLRRNLATTDAVSASQATTPDPNGVRPAIFDCAAPDGSRALFTSSSELTNDANTGEDGGGNPTDAGTDLYRYDVASRTLTDLTVSTDPADSATGAGVQGVVGCSDDAQTVYFVALGKLAPGATSGSPNLYVRRGGSTSFIATLDGSDAADWAALVFGKSAVVSGDGSHVAFTSVAPVTSFDNLDAGGTPQKEVYLYDAGSGSLECASCRAVGKPEGPSSVSLESPFRLRRGLADNGRLVFFESQDAIVPTDTNGRQDVYEYRQGGSPALLSGGNGAAKTDFLDASASGDDVFLATRNRLDSDDQDDLKDVYDARVGGGFPADAPAVPCAGATCRGTSSAPVPSTPETSTFFGSGNALVGSRAFFFLHPISGWAKKRLAKTGRITLGVDVSGPGRLGAVASAPFGGAMRAVARQTQRVRVPGVTRLSLRLNAETRRRLARHERLRVRLVVRFSAVEDEQAATVSLHR